MTLLVCTVQIPAMDSNDQHSFLKQIKEQRTTTPSSNSMENIAEAPSEPASKTANQLCLFWSSQPEECQYFTPRGKQDVMGQYSERLLPVQTCICHEKITGRGLRVQDGNGLSKMQMLVGSVETLGLRNGCNIILRFDQPRSICGKIFPVSDCLTKS